MKKNNSKVAVIEKYNEIWDKYPIYSTDSKAKVTSKGYDSSKCVKISCNLDDAMDVLYTDSKGRPRSDYISDKSLRTAGISMCKVGKKTYLTDDGAIFKSLSARGMKKTEFMKLLRMVNTDYDIKLLNNELSMEVESPMFLADCYRNMVNVMIKINCLAEATKKV
jgi:hypothetical protein